MDPNPPTAADHAMHEARDANKRLGQLSEIVANLARTMQSIEARVTRIERALSSLNKEWP